MTGPVRVVAAMGSEFLDDLRDLPALTGVPIEAHVLTPLDREMLRDVIEQPANVAGLRLEAGLAALLVADTDSGDALPLLAFTLWQLADGLPAGGTLSLARYHDLGGVHGALTRHADAALAEAVRASGLTEREILAGLTRLVTVDETGRRARRRIKLGGLVEPLRVALQIFVDRCLLLSNTDDGQVWLTVAHEALLTGWRPLDTATADITSALRTARAVEHAAADWNRAGRPEHYLWDDKRLTATHTTLEMASGNGSRNPTAQPIIELDVEALAFIDATTRRVHTTKKRERRRRTRTITVLSTLLVLALISASLAVWQQQQASLAQHIVTARQLVAQAEIARNTDPRTALQLGLAAQRIYPDSETSSSLVNLVTNTRYSGTLTGHTGPVSSVMFSPDGHTLATASSDSTVVLWDVTDATQPRRLGQPLTDYTGPVNAVAFSPDGHTLATASSDQTSRLWDISDRNQSRQVGQPLTGQSGVVRSVAFAPGQRTLATGSDDATTILWYLGELNIFQDHATQRACSITGGGLNRDEWARYIPGLPYEKMCPS